MAYWAEGAKTKPWGRRIRVSFSNSDPGMIVLFLRWLDLVGVYPQNVGDSYRGCLVVVVRRSADLNTRIEGWFLGLGRTVGIDDTGKRP